jgi:hypothetical protein
MTKHTTGTREQWLKARLDLLNAEKEHTRRSDELARRRRELPWVRIDKEYRFETDEGMERMGLSDIEGKTTRVGASKRGSERVSKRRSLISSEDAHSCSSIISCSGPTTPRAVRPARRLRMASTDSRFT